MLKTKIELIDDAGASYHNIMMQNLPAIKQFVALLLLKYGREVSWNNLVISKRELVNAQWDGGLLHWLNDFGYLRSMRDEAGDNWGSFYITDKAFEEIQNEHS